VARLDGRIVRRRYTIRDLDPSTATVTLDVVLHGAGPGARWVAGAAPGDRIEAIGPRGKVVVDPEADWHLFVGDEAFMPAAMAMAASVAPTAATSILEAAAADVAALDGQSGTDVRWVTRPAGRPVADGTGLLAALAAWTPGAGRGHVYVGGEARVVGTLRQALVERGLAAEQLSAKAYWRAGAANADHGEPERPPVS
jgi:NADPH-dependent ferric siderophore reductase